MRPADPDRGPEPLDKTSPDEKRRTRVHPPTRVCRAHCRVDARPLSPSARREDERDFLAGSFSIADIAVFAYTHVSADAGIFARRLSGRPAVDRTGRGAAAV